MKRVTLFVISVLCVSLVLAVPAMADMTLKLYDSYGSSNGGEFLATPSGFSFTPMGVTGGAFPTFCIERDEYISFGTTYYVDISTSANAGGVNTNATDPLDARTAYLYGSLISGTLSGYTYTTSPSATLRVRSANALQNTIWYLEEEISDPYYGFTGGTASSEAGLTRSLIDSFLSGANSWLAANPTAGIGSVRVMNLWTNSNHTGFAQDQLVMLPPQQIPAPGAALLAGIGMMLVVRLRRNVR